MPAKGVAPRRSSREGVLGAASQSGGDFEGETSNEMNRGHNLRPRRRTSTRYMDEEDDEDDYDSELDGEEGVTGGTSNGGGGDSAEKKRVGRPIAYRGDPNSPNLTEEERRRVKRRIANRESARRVRQKRQDVMEELQIKINALQGQNQRLMSHVGEVETHKSMLTGQVAALRNKWTSASSDNMRLQAELATLHKTLQMQQVNLELLQRGNAASGAPQPQPPGTPTATDVFGNIAAFYGLPSSGPAPAAAAASGPAASGGAAANTGGMGGTNGGLGVSAFSNNGPSAFSPIQPLHSAGIAAANAYGMQRQQSDAWNFLHAAARMGSGSLGLGAMGSLGSGQLAEGLGLAGVGLGSSSALNIAALNPAGSGRLPDLAPLNTAGSGRLSDLPPLPRAGSGRLTGGQPSPGQASISRPTPIPASAAGPFSAQQSAAAAEAMVARGSSTADPPALTGGTGLHREANNGGPALSNPVMSGGSEAPREVILKAEEAPTRWRNPDSGQPSMPAAAAINSWGKGQTVTTGAPPPVRPSMEEISALMFLKSSETPSKSP